MLEISKESGVVKLGHLALDGTKIKVNASKHKAMSYARMKKRKPELAAEVDHLLAEAKALDEQEDKEYGKGKSGDELPKEFRCKQARLAKIRQAKQALEEQARKEVIEGGKRDRDGNPPPGGEGGASDPPAGIPEDKKQHNFIDPESRIMLDGATKAFVQGYNGQAADVTQHGNDRQQLVPMVEQSEDNLGEIPDRDLGDAGYFSEENVEFLTNGLIEPSIPRDRTKYSDPPEPAPRGRIPNDTSEVDRMLRKLKTKAGKKAHLKRKETAEPAFG